MLCTLTEDLAKVINEYSVKGIHTDGSVRFDTVGKQLFELVNNTNEREEL
jgi:hypothetical protein